MAYRQHLDSDAVYHGQPNSVDLDWLMSQSEDSSSSQNDRMKVASNRARLPHYADIVESDGTVTEMKTRTILSA